MLSCKDVVMIVSLEKPLSLRQRLEFQLHLIICLYCRRYIKQIEYLKAGVKQLLRSKNKEAHSEEIKKIEKEVIEKLKI